MPQLDHYGFSSQVFWLILFFIGFYFILLKKSLPQIYKILIFRKKKIAQYSTEPLMHEKEIILLNQTYNTFVSSYLAIVNQFMFFIKKSLEENILDKPANKIILPLNLVNYAYLNILLDSNSIIHEKKVLKSKIIK